MKTWTVEKLVPRSDFEHSFEKSQDEDAEDFADRCAAACVGSPGCFKFKYDENDETQTCELRGNNMEESTSAHG